mmetsp:Transcript_53361/g.152232  ORF Transcript_53361/g.152232 Transcript_53361/m.152232 type:complete len:720 (-) Transcript_53361:12-2171(-)
MAGASLRVLLCALLALACEGQLDDAVGMVQAALEWPTLGASRALGATHAAQRGRVRSKASTEAVDKLMREAREKSRRKRTPSFQFSHSPKEASTGKTGEASAQKAVEVGANAKEAEASTEWSSQSYIIEKTAVASTREASESGAARKGAEATITKASQSDTEEKQSGARAQVEATITEASGSGTAVQEAEATVIEDNDSGTAGRGAEASNADAAGKRAEAAAVEAAGSSGKQAEATGSQAAGERAEDTQQAATVSGSGAVASGTVGHWAQQMHQAGFANWLDYNAHKRETKKKFEALGSYFSSREEDDAAATVNGLAWPAHAPMPKPALITMLNRARLGNRLFQWAALLSITKEAGARAAAPHNERYKPGAIPQLDNLEELIWSSEDMDWLNTQDHKCHMWDFGWPLKLDYDLGNLSNWTLSGVSKGELHIQSALEPRKGMNWARVWADAILTTPTPSPCSVVELDGFWQRPEFFVHHLNWLRPTFWNAEVAGQARHILDSWLEKTGPAGAVVGIHLRLGDYIGMGRNLDMDYYRNGLLEVKRHRNVDELTCVIFSDDIHLASNVSLELESCTKRIPVYPCRELGKEYHCKRAERVVNDRVSFYMMSQLPNIIIADSTYSFWAAVLAPNKPMVVTPRVVEPARIARRGDYSYLDSELYGWWGVNASLGNHTSKAVQKALDEKLKLDHEGASRWLAAGEKWKILQEEEYLSQVRESEWGA